MPDILITGEPEFYKSLSRALLNIGFLKKFLVERFVFSNQIEDKLVFSSIGEIEEKLKKQDVNLFIANIDYDGRCFEIVMRIRLGLIRECISGIPVILISALPFDCLTHNLILHHIKARGGFIEVPFTLDTLKRPLETMNRVDDHSLENIRRGLFYTVLNSVIHHMCVRDFRQRVKEIIKITQENRTAIYNDSLETISKVTTEIDKGKKTFEDLKVAVSGFLEKVRDDEEKRQK